MVVGGRSGGLACADEGETGHDGSGGRGFLIENTCEHEVQQRKLL